MHYSKAFFALQLRFAGEVARVTGLPFERALLDYTNLYIRFGLGRAFDADHPAWRRYVDGLQRAADGAEWTYRRYLQETERIRGTVRTPAFGCFSYAMQDDARVRIHFDNVDPTTVSPLGIERLPFRLRELRSLFAHVARHHPQAVAVVGTSWLHNLRAYQRCFPPAYAASATVAEARFRHLPLWGQFVDRHGHVDPAKADAFLRCVAAQRDARGLARCFPLQALAVDAPIDAFYRFYRVDSRV